MNPKTYAVRLRPFGSLTQLPYVFKLHAASERDALAWVARVFVGLDIEPTLRRWSRPAGSPVQVGNTDPVAIHDVDRTRSVRFARDRLAAQAPGAFRMSVDEVTNELFTLFTNLQEERLRMQCSFESMKRDYAQTPRDWKYQRLQQLAAGVRHARQWQANLWAEYSARVSVASFELPPVQPQALAA